MMRGFAIGLLIFTQATFAADEQRIKIKNVAENWEVVGVIADGSKEKPTGIVVLRNIRTQKTHTVSMGESLPGAPGFRVVHIERRRVEISGNEAKATLQYAQVQRREEDDSLHANRLLDDYYRSFSSAPYDIYRDQEIHQVEKRRGDPSRVSSPIHRYRRIGNRRGTEDFIDNFGISEDAFQRLEMKYDTPRHDSRDGFTVYYDNFTDSQEAEDEWFTEKDAADGEDPDSDEPGYEVTF